MDTLHQWECVLAEDAEAVCVFAAPLRCCAIVRPLRRLWRRYRALAMRLVVIVVMGRDGVATVESLSTPEIAMQCNAQLL